MCGSRIPSLHAHDTAAVHQPAEAPLRSEIDLPAIRRSHLNVLLIGPNDSNERALSALLPSCRTPVYDCDREFEIPDLEGGTCVLRRLELLSLSKQRVLHDWFSRASGRIQIVSLASPRLFELVSADRFDKALFYRLNVIMMTTGT